MQTLNENKFKSGLFDPSGFKPQEIGAVIALNNPPTISQRRQLIVILKRTDPPPSQVPGTWALDGGRAGGLPVYIGTPHQELPNTPPIDLFSAGTNTETRAGPLRKGICQGERENGGGGELYREDAARGGCEEGRRWARVGEDGDHGSARRVRRRQLRGRRGRRPRGEGARRLGETA